MAWREQWRSRGCAVRERRGGEGPGMEERLGSELQQSGSVLCSPLPYGAVKGQNPLEVPVRRRGAGPLPPPEPCLLTIAPTGLHPAVRGEGQDTG